METRQPGLLDSALHEADEEGSDVTANAVVLTEEEKEAIQQELARLEEEISTLRAVLSSKEKQHAELRQRLGVSSLAEIRNNVAKSWQDVQASNAYKRTSETLSSAGQKTSAAFSTFGSALSRKLGDMRNSPSFKSFEEKVETTVTTIKTKITPSGSGGSFEEVLSSAAMASSQDATRGMLDSSDQPC